MSRTVSGNLVATLFATLAAEMSDPDRFRRGRSYARDGAVSDIVVKAGVARGDVWGSRGQPYNVTVIVRPVRRAIATAATTGEGRPSLLLPRPDDLKIECTCPDWGDPCKHGVAMLFELGNTFAADTALLARWRQVNNPAPDDKTSARATTVAARQTRPDPLGEFFGTGYDPDPIPALPRLTHRPRLLDGNDVTAELVAVALDDAIKTLGSLLDDR